MHTALLYATTCTWIIALPTRCSCPRRSAMCFLFSMIWRECNDDSTARMSFEGLVCCALNYAAASLAVQASRMPLFMFVTFGSCAHTNARAANSSGLSVAGLNRHALAVYYSTIIFAVTRSSRARLFQALTDVVGDFHVLTH